MTATPDGISFAQLQELAKSAKTNTTDRPELPAPLLEASPQELIQFVGDGVQGLVEQIGTQFAYKLIADYCIYCMYQHHNEAFETMLNDHEIEAAGAWSRDAGHLQVMANILRNIHMGPQDFQVPTD